ncbi:MAG: cyclopropane-fatty-acyl-phospholipid synthase family protein [Pyrinomonadaceae bacterium]
MLAKQSLDKTLEKTLDKLFGQLSGGSFAVRYGNGTTETYGSGEAQFTLKLNDYDILSLIGDDMLTSFGEAYMDGRVDLDGDLADLMSLALRSGLMSVTQQAPGLAGAAMRVAGKLRSISHAKENVARHYDLGNHFFRLWLDESLTYSCAYFSKASDTLDDAQRQKIDHSLRKLRLQPDETLLDIGCGCGSLVIRAADHYSVTATGITLSEEQFAGANSAIEERGLQKKANVRLADYSVLREEGKQFDKIISIGMIEHVGKENLSGFVETVEKLLKPGGLALLHLITNVEEGPINRWIEKHIFPGGYIPTLPEIISHLATKNFRVWDVENLAPHYRLTLDHWSERFELVVPTVLEQFDERFVRMWRLYLRASSAAFREGVVEVHQILVSRGQPDDLPLTREDLYRGQG